ncbi:MAG TPA: class I SAM-dependent methyltransferase [Acidimicrobiales bacterium]|jgi:SAM-dependent methyltransferase
MTAARPVYDTIGQAYTTHRRPDPRWAALIRQSLGPARRVVNVGAGTGSYEPEPPVQVVAVEPSPVMIGQRAREAAPVIGASGTALPLLEGSFDAALAVLTLHHWGNWRAGLLELARVAPRRVVLTIDFEVHAHFWLLSDYLPEVAAVERALRPSPADIAEVIGVSEIIDLPLPTDFADGVLGAFWNRPEAYLDPIVRRNTSPLALADQATVNVAMTRLESDLADGTWHRRHGDLLELESCDLGYRLLICG